MLNNTFSGLDLPKFFLKLSLLGFINNLFSYPNFSDNFC